MAYITKRGNSYSVRYTYEDEHGKSCDKWESFPTKEEAVKRQKQIEHELATGNFLIPSTVTVAEFLMDWLPKQCSKHKWAPKTYQSNLALIQNLIIPYIGEMQMQKLRPYHIEALYDTLSKTPAGSMWAVSGETSRPSSRSAPSPAPPSMRSTNCCTIPFCWRWSGASSSKAPSRWKHPKRPPKSAASGRWRRCGQRWTAWRTPSCIWRCT